MSASDVELLRLGSEVVEYLNNRYLPIQNNGLEHEWMDRVRRDVATFKDVMEAGSPANVAGTELKLTLGDPEYIPLSFVDTGEPTFAAAAGFAWGDDASLSARYFVAAGIGVVFAMLAFAVLVYGLDPPSPTAAVAMASAGGISLAAAGTLLGIGLFRLYVQPRYLDPGRSTHEVEIKRITPKTYRVRWLIDRLMYSLGSTLLATGVAIVILVGRSPDVTVVEDATNLRLTALATFGAGVLLFGLGAWPIIRWMIIRGEINRQEGTLQSISPRIAVAALPGLTGLLLLALNWLSKS